MIQSQDTYGVGPCLEGYWMFGEIRYVADFIGLVGSESGVVTQQRLHFPLWGKTILGAGADAELLIHRGGQSESVSGQVSLGFEF